MSESESEFNRTKGVRRTELGSRDSAPRICSSETGPLTLPSETPVSAIFPALFPARSMKPNLPSEVLRLRPAMLILGSGRRDSLFTRSRVPKTRKEAVRASLSTLGLPFSPGIKFGDLLFISGQGPFDKSGKLLEGDIRYQT